SHQRRPDLSGFAMSNERMRGRVENVDQAERVKRLKHTALRIPRKTWPLTRDSHERIAIQTDKCGILEELFLDHAKRLRAHTGARPENSANLPGKLRMHLWTLADRFEYRRGR